MAKKRKTLDIDLGKLPEVNIKEGKKPGPMNKVPSNWQKTSIKADPKVLKRLKVYIAKTDKYETRDQLLNDLLSKFLAKKDI